MGPSRRVVFLVAMLAAALVAPAARADEPLDADAGFLVAAATATSPVPAGCDEPCELDPDIDYVRIPSFDGVEIEGWIGLPVLEPGERVPVALHATPYLGTCNLFAAAFVGGCFGTPDDASWWTSPSSVSAFSAWHVDPIELVRRGYAAAFFGVRGTGGSGGCFDRHGHAEQQDQEVVVEWLASQPWSNGRVGMGGVSYPGTTPIEAAVRQPDGLAAIVVAGTVTDLYTTVATPQGAMAPTAALAEPAITGGLTLLPPLGADPASGLPGFASGATDRTCEEGIAALTGGLRGYGADDRDAPYWEERRLLHRLSTTRVPILLAQGFQDDLEHGSVHGWQDHLLWEAAARAPKRQVVGQWGHTFPRTLDEQRTDLPAESVIFPGTWEATTWAAILFDWLDGWLQGEGRPEHVGRVDYQADDGFWHQSREWPPRDAVTEVLHLAATDLRAQPGADTERRTYRSSPGPQDAYVATERAPARPWRSLCDPQGGTGALFVGAPLLEDAVVAGNPTATLRLSSDQPGGIVAVHVLGLAPDFRCDADAVPAGVEVLTLGAADLRFHEDRYQAHPFAVGRAQTVRIDLGDLAEHLPAGHRVAVLVSHGEGVFREWSGQPWFPAVTVHAVEGGVASSLQLPVVQGSVGGAAERP